MLHKRSYQGAGRVCDSDPATLGDVVVQIVVTDPRAAPGTGMTGYRG
jgi:hypothetical protein